MRVLVTGSRDWPYPEVVWTELDKILNQLIRAHPVRVLTVVEGACPSGADLFAYQWVGKARNAGHLVRSERHPADWDQYGKAAGYIRNKKMVDKGAGLCLAFWLNESRGTRDCLDRAYRADIPRRVIWLRIEEAK